jgi:hypothetical protein
MECPITRGEASSPAVADLEVDEMDVAPPGRTPPDSDTDTEEVSVNVYEVYVPSV